MTLRERQIENLIRVKTALAEKYTHRAQIGNSKPWKARMLRAAERYRRQVARLQQGRGI